MAFRIPDDIIYEIKNSVDILNVVGDVVKLRRTGQNHIGLCPFHAEKTPSFTVNQAKQMFHCFGCGEGGDVFGFLMKMDNLSYPEAIRVLADRTNIRIPESAGDGESGRRKSERERLYEMYAMVMQYYQERLENTAVGQGAKKYLEKREISLTVTTDFRLGYAPAGWTHLQNMLSKKYPKALLEKSGLIVFRDGGQKTYDRFRNRIMFPIFDVNDRVIGFGGRAIDDAVPKYLNSPETLTYNKRRSLYGLNRAKLHCRKSNTVHIVEGYFDCISLHQYGIENAVATLGTALTPEQVRILKGYAENVVLVYDADEAGIKAAVRSMGIFLAHDVQAKVLVLPEGQDPDSFIRARGVEKFLDMASGARNIFGFLLDTASGKNGPSPEGRIRTVNDMLEPMAAISDPVARSLYVRELAEHVMIDEAAVLQKLGEFKRQTNNVSQPTRLGTDNFNNVHQGGKQVSLLERRIIAMMLQFPEIIADIEKHDILKKFDEGVLKSLGMIILKHWGERRRNVSDLLVHINDDEMRRIVSELSLEDDVWDRNGCLRLIRQFERITRKKMNKKLIHEIKNAENNNDLDLLQRLLNEQQRRTSYGSTGNTEPE